MSGTNTQGGMVLADTAAESAVKKFGEKAVDRGLNAIVDFVKGKYGEARVKIGTAFDRYLENASLRYNQIRTLATGTTPRKIIGEDSLYVSIGVNHNGEEISTETVNRMLEISKNILILGTGGVGKSMLMRYLFLDTARYEGYVPVLIELRRIKMPPSGQISILNLIYDCMKDFDVELPMEQFEYSLRLGKYLFLLDGFDEVKSSLAKDTAMAIQAFSAKYPNNSYIVTSRPRKEETSPLETFTVMESMPLNKEQAIDLASRIWEPDEKTREFCQQLDAALYEKHRDFAENPLLLTMMFLTFMRNSSIPEHLSDFYKKAYDALYSAHDNQDKGCYRRDFQCKTLDENEFKHILSHFCFQSYFKEIYEFSEDAILRYLETSLQKLKFCNLKPADYLEDLRNIVCMIIKDGDTYRFSHRSFQAYFAAYYTTHFLTDEQQRQLFAQSLSGRNTCFEKADYYTLLIQIEPERFAENALEIGLRKLYQGARNTQYPDEFILKSGFLGVAVEIFRKNIRYRTGGSLSYRISRTDERAYNFNVIALFTMYAKLDPPNLDLSARNTYLAAIRDYAERIEGSKSKNAFPKREEKVLDEVYLAFDEIDASDRITDDERRHFYSLIIQYHWADGIYDAVSEWLAKLDAKRASLKSSSFIDDL